jgi:WD repeat-containing protein 76
MWISDGSGGVTHLDLREYSSQHRRYELSEQKIGCLSLNPVQTQYLLTSSNNRQLRCAVYLLSSFLFHISQCLIIRIWDTRSFKDIVASLDQFETEVEWSFVSEYLEKNKDSPLLRGEWRHDKSVSAAYWDPRGRSIVSTSYDDNLRCKLDVWCSLRHTTDVYA